MVMIKGKKSIAQSIVYKALESVKKQAGADDAPIEVVSPGSDAELAQVIVPESIVGITRHGQQVHDEEDQEGEGTAKDPDDVR